MWNAQVYARISYVKRNLLLSRSGSRVTRRLSGALGLMRSVTKAGAFILSVQYEG
jgi:hypothetical protein